MNETTIYLIRHAQSDPRASRNHTDWPLSTTGEKQALALSSLLYNLEIDKFFTSPFLRCKQTIEAYVKRYNINIEVEDDLRERLITKEIVEGFYAIWCKGWEDFEFSLPGCESSAVAQKRFVNAVTKIVEANPGETIALSTHGNVIGLFLNWIDSSAGREEAEAINNPDVLKIIVEDGVYYWDSKFILPGITEISTDFRETLME